MRFLPFLLLFLLCCPSKSQFISWQNSEEGLTSHTDTPFIVRYRSLHSLLDTSRKHIVEISNSDNFQWPDTIEVGYPAWLTAFIDTINLDEGTIRPEIIEIISAPEEHTDIYMLTVSYHPCYKSEYFVSIQNGELISCISVGGSGCGEGFSSNSKAWMQWNPKFNKWNLFCLSYDEVASGGWEGAMYTYLGHYIMEPVPYNVLNYPSMGPDDPFIDEYLKLFGIRSLLKLAVKTQ